ncbi:MAG: beta-propeller fold lactonase family protein [Rhodothermales bacterium]
MTRSLLAAAVLLLTFAGCDSDDPADPFDPDGVDYGAIETPQFARDVQPLLTARCADCHGGADAAAGLDVTSWASLIAGSDAGEALIAFDPDNSVMIELMTKLPESHPAYAAHRLRDAEVAFLRRWIEQGARSDDGAVPFAGVGGGRLYVSNQAAGQVSIIDVERLVVARTVSFAAYGGPMETNPHDTDVEPDGSAWYVSLINANRVLKYDASTNEVIGEALLGSTFKPGMLALNPADGRLYAGRSFSDLSGGESIFAVERAGMTATEVPIPYTRPHPIAVTNGGGFLLSGSLADNEIAAFDLSDASDIELADLLTVAGQPKAFVHYAVSPVGGVAVLTSQLSRELYFLDISDPTNLRILSVVEVGDQPWHPTYSPDGRTVYVPNRLSNTVSVIDATNPANPTVTATISDPAFSMPHGSAITRDGRLLFVSSRNQEGGYTPRYPFGDNALVGTVAVIDTQTNTVVKVLEVEEFASGMSIYQP